MRVIIFFPRGVYVFQRNLFPSLEQQQQQQQGLYVLDITANIVVPILMSVWSCLEWVKDGMIMVIPVRDDSTKRIRPFCW